MKSVRVILTFDTIMPDNTIKLSEEYLTSLKHNIRISNKGTVLQEATIVKINNETIKCIEILYLKDSHEEIYKLLSDYEIIFELMPANLASIGVVTINISKLEQEKIDILCNTILNIPYSDYIITYYPKIT